MHNFNAAIILDDVFKGYRCHLIPSSLRITRQEFIKQTRIVCKIKE